jgi:hypothetical protein
MGLSGLECEPQRLPRPQEMSLAYELLKCARAEPVGKRGLRFLPAEEIIH